MRLREFILANVELILQEWETFARTLPPGQKMDVTGLRDDAESILRACARDMDTAQSHAQQSSKSMGHGGAGGAASERLDNASAVHGVGRVGSGFNLNELVAEYRALRASVLRLWRDSNPDPDTRDLDDMTRFNETIDQSLAKAVAGYSTRVDQARRMFLAILSHDLRNPLNCIRMSALLAARKQLQLQTVDPDSTEAFTQIETSVEAISRLIQDLLDFAASGLGEGIPLSASPVNLAQLAREVFDELRSANPQRDLRFHAEGDLSCTCDGGRIRQVISNLVGNAIQHGSPDGPIELSLTAPTAQHDGPDGPHPIRLSVHNSGQPIAPSLLPIMFDPLVRERSQGEQLERRPGSIGLGLYIAHEIVIAHRGEIDVESTAQQGTTFTVRLPRKAHSAKLAPADEVPVA
jgi:signal transduction histidine kinase